MGFFAKRPTSGDCIDRVDKAMNEVMVIRDMLDTISKEKEYKADWDSNRKYAHAHLSEAWGSLGAALGGLSASKRWPTWDEQIEIRMETQQKHLATLRAEVERLERALKMAEARAAATERITAQRAQPQEDNELIHKVRRVVMSAVHPDKAMDAAEGEWRTRLCQALFPEIDRVMRRAQ